MVVGGGVVVVVVVEPVPPLPGQRIRLLRADFLALVFALALTQCLPLALAVGAPDESAAGRTISSAPQVTSAATLRIPLFREADITRLIGPRNGVLSIE